MDKSRFIRNNKDAQGNWSILNLRNYFDCYSNEFKSQSVELKLNNLGMLISGGFNLTEVVMAYCDSHSQYIVDAVKPTLLLYIQQIRWGEPTHFTDEHFDDLTEVELALLVEDEIKLRYLSSFNEVECSRWDDSILNEMVKRANGSREKLTEILTTINFSKEYINH